MSYVSSSSPLPTNSLVPGPPAIDEYKRYVDFMASRTGRERVYANMPTAASLWHLGPGLAVDASQRIGQSETARQAVLTGLGAPQPTEELTLQQIQAGAPVVSSLNGSPGSNAGLDTTTQGLMPAPAPVQTVGGLWASAKLPGGGTGKGQRGRVSMHRGGNGHSQIRSTPALGPACRALPATFTPSPVPALPSPPLAPNPPSPASVPINRTPPAPYLQGVYADQQTANAIAGEVPGAFVAPAGGGYGVYFTSTNQPAVETTQIPGVSGYSPAWGDASMEPGAGQMPVGGGVKPWVWLAIAGVGVFALTAKKGRR
jgi:hypothetical protein